MDFLIPLRKFEIDFRRKLSIRLNTKRFSNSLNLNWPKKHFLIRRFPSDRLSDEKYELKIRENSASNFSIDVRILSNFYKILVEPEEKVENTWKISGVAVRDRFTGSLKLNSFDLDLSMKIDLNHSVKIEFGRFVEIFPPEKSQIGARFRYKNSTDLGFQFGNAQSQIGFVLKFLQSDFDFFFVKKRRDENSSFIEFRFNSIVEQRYIFSSDGQIFRFFDLQQNFCANFSTRNFSLFHRTENLQSRIFLDENFFRIDLDSFLFVVSNRPDESTRQIEFFDKKTKKNVTISFYKTGKFSFEPESLQTPIVELSLFFRPNDEPNRFVRLFLELFPLRMSTFSFVRGRTLSIGAQTFLRQVFLEADLAFGLDDISSTNRIRLNEPWKIFYGYQRQQKFYIKPDILIDRDKQTVQGFIDVNDPFEENPIRISTELGASWDEHDFFGQLRTDYFSSVETSSSIDHNGETFHLTEQTLLASSDADTESIQLQNHSTDGTPTDDSQILHLKNLSTERKSTTNGQLSHSKDLSKKQREKSIFLDFRLKKSLLTTRNVSIRLKHLPSRTNLSFSFLEVPSEKLALRFKPNQRKIEENFLFFVRNETAQHSKLIVELNELIDLNFKLNRPDPDSFHSTLFLDRTETFDFLFENSKFVGRLENYFLNVSRNHFLLTTQNRERILGEIAARWIDQNRSVALLQIVTPKIFSLVEKEFFRFENFENFPFFQKFSRTKNPEKFAERIRKAFFRNALLKEFFDDFNKFLQEFRRDLTEEQRKQTEIFFQRFILDDDFRLFIDEIESFASKSIETAFLFIETTEDLIQRYFSK